MRYLSIRRTSIPTPTSRFAGALGLVALLATPLLSVRAAWAQDAPEKGDEVPAPPRLAPGMPGPRTPMSPGGPNGPISPPKLPTPPQEEPDSSGRSATITSGDGAPGTPTVKHVPCVPPNTKVTMDYFETPLLDVTKYMAEITCRNFILGDKLDGQVTIISHQPVTVEEAYQAFLSALAVADYTTVTVGRSTKVVKAGEAAKTPLRIYYDEAIPETDQYVTEIIHLDNVQVNDVSDIVTSLGGEHVSVIKYPATNTLIVTDAAYNIRRVYRIIKELDVAAPKVSLVMIPLRYAAASDVQKILDDIFGVSATSSSGSSSAPAASPTSTRRRRRDTDTAEAPAASGPTSVTAGGESSYIAKILADDRTNSLIVQANDAAVAKIKDLIAKLDVDVDPYSKATIHVIQLNYAKASDVASTLSNLTDSRSGGSSTSSASRSSGTSGRSTSGTNRSSTPARSSSGSSSSSSRSSGFGKPEESGGAGPDGLPGGAPIGPGQGGGGGGSAVAAFDNGMRITADENTNRLLVVAAPEDFRVIERVVKDLDIRRQQVYVEAVVVEVASQDDSTFGIGYHGGKPGDSGALSLFSGQLGANSVSLPITDTGTLLSGLAVGVFGQSFTIPITVAGVTSDVAVPAFGIALNALASNSKVDILSNPNVLCVDNEEATISVGRNVPFPVSSGRDNNNNPIVSYQREDVGITLKVTPQINEANYVTLDTNLEVQEVEEASSSASGLDPNTAGFITSKRETEQTILVRDNQTVVIGGLIGNTETESESKIPVLGDLPLVGVLFRSKSITMRRTNLLIFLTPHVINEPADLEEVMRVKVAQRDEFIRRFYGKSREEQEKEFNELMQGSMNIVDQPSMYRLKAAPDATGTIEITREGANATGATPPPATTSVPQPSADPNAAGAGN